MKRDSMVFYRSFYESVKDLPPDEFKRCMVAILDYGLEGIVTEGAGVESVVLRLVKPQIDKNNQRYLNGKQGGRKTNQTETKINQKEPNLTKPEPNVNVNVNEYVKESTPKGVPKKSTAFHPPTIEQVQAYVTEKGYKVDAQRFVDFYESKGWFVGKNKMKDWKAAVRNWSRTQRQEVTTKAKTNFTQRDNDYALLQERLIER